LGTLMGGAASAFRSNHGKYEYRAVKIARRQKSLHSVSLHWGEHMQRVRKVNSVAGHRGRRSPGKERAKRTGLRQKRWAVPRRKGGDLPDRSRNLTGGKKNYTGGCP